MNKLHSFKCGFSALMMALIMMLSPVGVLAQATLTVTGTVVDESNEPLIGAAVTVKNTNVAVITDIDGNYTIKVPADGTLVFSYVGYSSLEEAVKNRTTIDVAMQPDSKMLDAVVVVGYGVQRRGSVTGAVSGIKGDDMIKTKNENPQNMLTGRIPGVRVWQKSSEPGTYNNNMDIRGMGSPLVVIDGIPRTVEEFQRINANDIEDISVLKDASAAIYGVRAANGVLLVTTKGGSKGKTKVSYSGSYTIQKPNRMPELANAIDAMTIVNEQRKNNINGGSPIFTQETIDAYRNGTLRATDWNSLIIAETAPQTQHDISISGGNDRTQYYVSFGYFYQEGIFKSGDLNYNKYNLRANISTEILRGLKFDANIAGMADQRNTPWTSSVSIIRNYWRQGVLNPAYADEANTMLNYAGLTDYENTVAEMTSDISGYRKYSQKTFESSANLTFDFGAYSSVFQGLTAKALINYDYRMDNNTHYRKEYSLYSYDPIIDTYDKIVYGESSPSRIRREFYDKQQVLWQFILNYNRTFNNTHHVGALIGWESQNRKGDNFYAQRDLAFSMPYLFAGVKDGEEGSMSSDKNDIYEYANNALIGRLNYSYNDRYLIEAQFRYDGSSKFAKGHRWGFFPSISAGWRISEEPFFRSIDANKLVNQLKLRASYGELGDDSGIDYEWAMGYIYPATSNNMASGDYNGYSPGYVIDGNFILAATPKSIPNANLSWYKSRTLDLGVDLELRNGIFGASFDYFYRKRTGLFERRSGDMPSVVGATAPLENVNSDAHMGLELELTHHNRVGEVSYDVKGIVTVTRNKYLTAVQKGPWANSYDRWRNDNLNNRYQGVQFGYTEGGRFESWEQIWNYKYYLENNTLPGDFIYEDWNGDGEISSLDEHPYAFDQTPWMNYSLNLSAQWRDWDLSMLWQGSALGSMEYKEPLREIWGDSGGGVLEQYTDRWHPSDPNADPWDPSITWIPGYYAYTGRYAKSNSAYNRVSTDYLRLKSIELGYTIPRHITRAVDMRLYFNAYNLLTFTKVKFVDPEHPDDDLGRMYPLNKTFTFGLNVSF